MKRVRVTLVAAVMASLIVSSVAMGAGGKPAGGKIKIFVVSPDKLKSQVVVVGAIGDYGTAVSQDKNGKPDIEGSFEKFTLKQGGFTVDASGLNKALNNVKPTINLATCSVDFAGSGPGTVSKGTGLYAGISGKLKISIESAEVVPRKNGKCVLSQNAKPLAEYDTVSASGTVTFS
jgi:hypothetical protein